MKKYTNFLKITALCALGAFTILQSCKQRDDYPTFEKKEPVDNKPDVIPEDHQIEPITKRIMDNTTLIKTFQMDSTSVEADGMTITHVRFINSLNQPVSLRILQVDLKKPKMGVVAMSPYDDNLYNSQAIFDMAKYNEARAGGEIKVAINGDASSSGEPTGSFIKLGRQIKVSTTSATANVRPFFAVKYDGTCLIGNRPNTTITLDPYNLNDFKYLVSGTTWLLYKGGLVNSTVATVQANTAIGIDDNQKIYAVVVDGGNNLFSVGMNYNDLGKLISVIGATSAFVTNSGSSAVIVRKTKVNDVLNPIQWVTLNKPAVNNGTPSANGIGFILKN